MKVELSSRTLEVRAEKTKTGLIYGLLAGAGFTLTAWGIDAYLLASSHTALPWVKLLMGGIVALLLCGFAGWITAKADHALVGLIAWIVAGVLLGWVTAHLPFEGFQPVLVRLFNPQLQGIISYPFTETASARMLIIYWTFAIAAPLTGLLELPLVEGAVNATSPFGRLLSLSLAVVIFAVAGVSADNQANELLRSPMVTLDRVIRFALSTRGTEVDRATARQMHLSVLNKVQDRIDEDRRMFVREFDTSIIFVNVLVESNGRWSNCTVINDQPGFCEPVELSQLRSDATGGAAQTAELSPAERSSANQGQAADPDPTQPAGTPEGSTGLGQQAGDHEPASTQAASVPAASMPAAVMLPAAQADLDALPTAPRYHLELNVDYAAHSYQGKARVDYTNAETASLDRLYFRLLPNGHASYGNGSLSVSQVLLNGEAAVTELSQDNTVLAIDLPEPLPVGEQVQVDFQFSGLVPLDFGGEASPSGYGIFNMSDGVLALSSWYPILAVYDEEGWNLDPVSPIGDSVFSDIAFYEVDITTASDLVLAATGVEGDPTRSVESRSSEGSRSYHFSSGPVRDFFIIMSPDFHLENVSVDGTLVNSYYLGNDLAGGRSALEVAASSLQIFNQRFGAYPYAELDIVEAPMRNASGVEFPGIVLISQALYGDPENPSFTTTTAHEVAHQWWYNVVGNDVFDEPWLDEGLTTYSSSLYFENKYGDAGSQGLFEYYQDRYNQAVKKGEDDLVTRNLHYFEGLNNPSVYGAVVYSKGALFFKALRQDIGDQAFFEALQNYFLAHRYQIAEGEDLLDAFEQTAGRQLDDIYTQWLYSSS